MSKRLGENTIQNMKNLNYNRSTSLFYNSKTTQRVILFNKYIIMKYSDYLIYCSDILNYIFNLIINKYFRLFDIYDMNFVNKDINIKDSYEYKGKHLLYINFEFNEEFEYELLRNLEYTQIIYFRRFYNLLILQLIHKSKKNIINKIFDINEFNRKYNYSEEINICIKYKEIGEL